MCPSVHFTPFHPSSSELHIKLKPKQNTTQQQPKCVKLLQSGVLLGYEASRSPRRTARSTSRVRGMEKSKDVYTDTIVPRETEECLMLSPREQRKHVVGACSHSVSSWTGMSGSMPPEQIWEHEELASPPSWPESQLQLLSPWEGTWWPGGYQAGLSHWQSKLDSAKSLSITAWNTIYFCPSSPQSAKAAPRLNIISALTALQEMAAPTGTGRNEGRECVVPLPLPERFISTVVF